jgi:tRNA modification GTPase
VFSTTDTIVAIATPPGRGGIGVVRLSGSGARAVAAGMLTCGGALEPRHATFTRVRGAAPSVVSDMTDENAIDQVVATYFPAPHSYTGEDVVELSGHGSPVTLRAIVQAAIDGSARLAEPGEFTLRAFLNGRMDLMQAEAVADLIDAATPLQARVAFDQLEGTLTRTIADIDAGLFDLIAKLEASVDFPDEGYHFVEPGAVAAAVERLIAQTSALVASARRGRLIREGLLVAIVGKPNVGKSSLFNALVGASRAIVADVPGTTRDLVTEVVDLDGLRVTLVDTAGLRDTGDAVEAEGVARSRQALAVADLVLHVVDDDDMQTTDNKQLIVRNKTDLISGEISAAVRSAAGVVCVSVKTGAGLEALRTAIVEALDFDPLRDRASITNVRHLALVERAQRGLIRARLAAGGGADVDPPPDGAPASSMSEEFVLADLQDARAALEEITGRRAPEELLAHIFARFCVGK